jgi:hypothetical protein
LGIGVVECERKRKRRMCGVERGRGGDYVVVCGMQKSIECERDGKKHTTVDSKSNENRENDC